MSYVFSVSVVAISLVSLVVKRYLAPSKPSTQRLPYPPGPNPFPLIGNLLDVPTVSPWVTYMNWAAKYGDLMHISVLGTHVVLINSAKVARDLFEKRVYSDRPSMAMINLMGWNFTLGFLPYNDEWRRQRRLFHEIFRAKAALAYQPLEEEKAHYLLRNLSQSPKDAFTHVRNFAASLVLQMAYGYQMAPKDDRLVAHTESTVEMLTGGISGAGALVNAFPSLQYLPGWLPGAGFQAYARKCRDMIKELLDVPFETVKNNMAAGTGIPCLSSELLEKNNAAGGDPEEEQTIKRVAAGSFVAGADTTTSTLKTFLLAMVLNPDVQIKAQQEIDRVVGHSRLPNFDDRDSLIYVEALVREVMRWHPPLPLGLPHATFEDDIYNGYLIPKGATVLGNIWAITHDEAVYPDPYKFYPDRFIMPDGQLNDDLVLANFGFGRRICGGLHLARAAAWIAIVSVLATFNITKAKDESGKEIEVPEAYSEGLVLHPTPFQCSITPRSNTALELIQAKC